MKNVIITVLSIAVIILGGYLVYDKVTDKKDDKIENNNKVEEDNSNNNGYWDYDLEKAQELMNIYVDTIWGSEIFDGLNDDLKLRIAYRNLKYSSYPDTIPYEELNKVYNKLFALENALKKDFTPGGWCKTYKFNSEQNSYVYNESQGCGGASWSVNYVIKSATVKDSKLDIVVYYYEIDSGIGNLYKYNKDKSSDTNKYKIADLTNSERTSDNKLTVSAFETYKNQMDTFIFRFKKYNENYVLKEVFKN